MRYEKRHYACNDNLVGSSLPEKGIAHDLIKEDFNYIGTFSEYNPIGLKQGMVVAVVKDNLTTDKQKDFKLPGFKLKGGMSYHGHSFNNNVSIYLSKAELLEIAEAMDDTDKLWISVPDEFSEYEILTDIDKVCGK